MVEIASITPESQEHHPPGTIRSLHEIAVAGTLDLMSLGDLTELRQDRIDGIGLVRTPDVAASGHGKAMSHLGSAF